eukprot:3073184-Rhodomonas_salina.1
MFGADTGTATRLPQDSFYARHDVRARGQGSIPANAFALRCPALRAGMLELPGVHAGSRTGGRCGHRRARSDTFCRRLRDAMPGTDVEHAVLPVFYTPEEIRRSHAVSSSAYFGRPLRADTRD